VLHSGSRGVDLLASISSYFFVVRDLAITCTPVTEAMMRLANGERGVSVTATRPRRRTGGARRAFSVFRETALALERVDIELREKSETPSGHLHQHE